MAELLSRLAARILVFLRDFQWQNVELLCLAVSQVNDGETAGFSS
jgi:hypothetical protein